MSGILNLTQLHFSPFATRDFTSHCNQDQHLCTIHLSATFIFVSCAIIFYPISTQSTNYTILTQSYILSASFISQSITFSPTHAHTKQLTPLFFHFLSFIHFPSTFLKAALIWLLKLGYYTAPSSWPLAYCSSLSLSPH